MPYKLTPSELTVLQLIETAPAHGYRLTRRTKFSKTTVYRAVQQLKRYQLVNRSVSSPEKKPDQHRYRLSRRGRVLAGQVRRLKPQRVPGSLLRK